MLSSFHKLTRRGIVRKVTAERYLRDDVSCRLEGCAQCAGGAQGTLLEPAGRAIIVLDTNVVLHQMDVLEAAGADLCDVVILATVLDEQAALGRLARTLTALKCDERSGRHG